MGQDLARVRHLETQDMLSLSRRKNSLETNLPPKWKESRFNLLLNMISLQ